MFKEKLTEWLSSTSCHGYSHLLKAKHLIIKLMWSVFIAASIATCSLFVIRSVLEFYAHDVNTKIRSYSENPTVFPAVTICSLDSFNTPEDEFRPNINLTENFLDKENKINELRRKFYSKPEYEYRKNTIGLRKDRDILICTYFGIECSLVKFETIYDMNYGNCLRFNGATYTKKRNRSLIQSYRWGQESGLYLEIYTGLLDKNSSQDHYNRKGFHVIIHNNSVIPDPIMEGLSIRTNTLTRMGIKKTYISQEPYPFSDCKDKPESEKYAKVLTENGIFYRQKDCLVLCLQEYLFNQCGCNVANYRKLDEKIKLCETLDEMKCSQRTFYNFDSKFPECLEKCPHECKSTAYSITTSHANYPSKDHLKNIKDYLIFKNFIDKNVDEKELSENIAALDIYYEDLRHYVVTEIPGMTIQSLISTIGGHLGLFLGMSFLSFIEIFQFLIDLMLIGLKNRDKNNQVINLH